MKPGRVGALLACASAGVAAAGLATAQTPAKEKPLYAHLSGAKEVSKQGNKGVGDPNGRGTATVYIAGGKLCFGLTVYRIAKPAAAHIHKGNASTAGDVLVPLSPLPKTGNPGGSGGCVNVKAADAAAIRKNPGGYYVNVHTSDFPDGAIRGQLFTVSGK